MYSFQMAQAMHMPSSQVEALAVQLTQREGELIQEKAEVKRLASFLKQVKLMHFSLSLSLSLCM